MSVKKNFIRVGVDYFKIINKVDRYGIDRTELKRWNKQEIIQDYGKDSPTSIPKFDDFILEPNNINYQQSINNCFNMYRKFAHQPIEGEWLWTRTFLEHVFGEQYEIGMIYMQCLYLYPKQALPVIALVSKERQTGKSTFIDWLTSLFGQNMVIVDSSNFSSDFNGVYASANIIGIEETFIDKKGAIEKVKAISTQKTMTVNMKQIQHFSLPFFGKIIMTSNNEDKFIKIDESEIRFFVRKLNKLTNENHKILTDMIKEIPSFLHHLTTLEKPDFSKSRMVFTAAELANGSLQIVKEESKTWLYKELQSLFQEFFFNTNSHEEEDLEVSPIDIKERWFSKNNQIQLSYIKSVLKDEFSFKKSKTIKRYAPFFSDNKTGTPYLVPRNTFTDYKSNETELLPF